MTEDAADARRSILIRAIQIEARNGAIYDSLAQIFQGYDDAVTALFREMADEERQHGAELEKRYQERFGPAPPPKGEPKEVIEGPDLDDAEALIFDSMTIEQALVTGVGTEEAAREFYRVEAARATDPEFASVYRELADFEETHVRLLKEKLSQRQGASGAAVR